jgi:hypothetical protein
MFGECRELVEYLAFYLTDCHEFVASFAREESFIVFINNLLSVMELLVRNEAYRLHLESSPQVLSNLLLLFELVESDDVKVLALRLVTSLGISSQSKLEICKRDGFKKILQLLLDENQNLTKEVIRTLKHFLEAGSVEEMQQASPGFGSKIKKVLSGMAKLAKSLLPNEDHQIDLDLQLETSQTSDLPPTEMQLRLAFSKLEQRLKKDEEEENKLATMTTPTKDQDSDISKEDLLKDFLRAQGALSTITKALHEAAMEVQLDLMETLSILLTNSTKNEKEFRRIEGYQLISELFDRIRDYSSSPKSTKFLENSFGILRTIILNGKSSNIIGNMHALRLILHIAAHSPQTAVVKMALVTLQDILKLSWENALCICDEEGLGYLLTCLKRIVQKDPEQPLGTYNQDQFISLDLEERKKLYEYLDEIMKYTSFIIANAYEKNSLIISVYSQAIRVPILYGMISSLLESIKLLLSDLTSRYNSSSSFSKNVFMSAFDTVKSLCDSLNLISSDYSEEVYKMLPCICLYESLYTEAMLSSLLTSDSKNNVLTALVENREFLLDLIARSKTDAKAEWMLIMMLSCALGCREVDWVIAYLISENRVSLVTKILMLEDFPGIDKARGESIREKILHSECIRKILPSLSSYKYLYLLLACVKDSPRLKTSLFQKISHTTFSEYLQPTMDSFHCLYDICTEKGYLEFSDYISDINKTLPLITKMEADSSSTRASSASMISAAAIALREPEIHIIQAANIMTVLNLLPKANHETQSKAFEILYKLSRSYHNKRVLYKLQFCKVLLKILHLVKQPAVDKAIELVESVLSYSVSEEEADLILQLCQDPEYSYRTHLLRLLVTIIGRDISRTFYSLDYTTLESPTFTTFPKNGYSLMFWVKLRKPSLDSTALFAWVDHNKGLILFQLTYKHSLPALEKKSSNSATVSSPLEKIKYKIPLLNSSQSSSLTIQAPSQAFLPTSEDTCNYETELSRDWTHICLVHGKNGVLMYINGRAFPIYKCSHFGLMKDKNNITGIFGDKHLSALYSGIMCVDGCLDQSQVQSIINQGVFDSEIKDLDYKLLFSLPEQSGIRPVLSEFTEVLNDGQISGMKELPTDSIPFDGTYILPRTSLQLSYDDSLLHQTMPVKEALNLTLALPQFFAMLRRESQSEALMYVSEYITCSQNNYKNFKEISGWSMIESLISRNHENCSDKSLEYLMSAICNKPYSSTKLRKMLCVKREIIPVIPEDRIEGLHVICDLLTILPAVKTVGLVESLSNLMYREENVKLFLEQTNGFVVFLDLLLKQSSDSMQILSFHTLSLFERLIESIGVEHIECMIDFLTSPELKDNLIALDEFVADMLCLIQIHIVTGSTHLLDKFMATEGHLLLFELLTSSSEKIKCAALKFVGLLLNVSNKFKSWFKKHRGYDILNTSLGKSANGLYPYDLLITLACNKFDHVAVFFPPESGSTRTIINHSSIAARALPVSQSSVNTFKILYPEALEVLVDLLKKTEDENLKLQVFFKIEKILDDENCEKILRSSFLKKCAGMISEDAQSLQKSRDAKFSNEIFEVIKKLCIYDLNSSKQKILEMINSTPDCEPFMPIVFELVLNLIEENPCFDSPTTPSKHLNNFMRNLMNLFNEMEGIDHQGMLFFRVMQLINSLASVNTPAVRSLMKSCGYFEFRDNLLIYMLRAELQPEELKILFTSFSFETIASQAKFRDAGGLFYVLKILIEQASDHDLQLAVLGTLREDICVHEDNRKDLKKFIENKACVEYLLKFKTEDSSIMPCFRSMRAQKLDVDDDNLPREITAEEFMTWLNSSDARKRTILATCLKQILPIDTELKKSSMKRQETKTNLRKKATDSVLREKAKSQKSLHEMELKIISRISKSEERCKERFSNLARSREARNGSLSIKSL